MTGREQEAEAPSFENTPAYEFAQEIHEKNPHRLKYQSGVYPLTSTEPGNNLGVGFSFFDPPTESVAYTGDNQHTFLKSRSIEFGDVHDDFVDTRYSLGLGPDGIVIVIDDIGFGIELKLPSDEAVRTVIAEIEAAIEKPEKRVIDLESIAVKCGSEGIPPEDSTLELFRSIVDRFSNKRKDVTSKIVLGKYTHVVNTRFDNGSAVEVSLERSRNMRNNIRRNEVWKFSSLYPPEFSVLEYPAWSEDDPLDKQESDASIADSIIKGSREASAVGRNLALRSDINRGLSMLNKLSKSWRSRYVQSK